MSRNRLHWALLPSALALWSAGAHAAPGDATRLEYARSEAAKHCPDRDALKSAVRKRLGYDPFFPAARQTIVVEITDVADGLRAQMHLLDEQGLIIGSRELHEHAEQCDELVASLALAISIALDPSAALGVAPSADAAAANDSAAPDPPASDDDEAVAPASIAAEPPPARTRRVPAAVGKSQPRPLAIAPRAAAFVALGVAPAAAWGVRGGVGVRRADWQLLAEFAAQFPAQRAVDSGTVRASLYEGSLAPCLATAWLSGCGLINVGVMNAEGTNIPYPAKHRSLYAALGARIEAAPQLAGHLRLLLDADVLKSLTPITLRLHSEEVWKTPFVSVALGIGLALQFP